MGRLTQAAGLLSFPPTLAHELTHWAIASLETDDAHVAVEVSGGRALAAWPPLESRLLRVFAFLGPTVFGSILSVLWLISGTSVDGWRLLLAVGLAIYTVPSASDVRGALGKQEVQTHDTQTTH